MEMADSGIAALRVAILSRSARQRNHLSSLLEANGLQVLPEQELQAVLPGPIDRSVADVLVVSLDDGGDLDDSLDAILEHVALPVLFADNDSAAQRKSGRELNAWGRRLASKLFDLAREESVSSQPPANVEPPVLTDAIEQEIEVSELSVGVEEARASFSVVVHERPVVRAVGGGSIAVEATATERNREASRVWVLGASIGGPEAVKEFLAALPPGLPTAFVLAQHIGASFVPLLAEQLRRVTKLTVYPAEHGRVLQNGQLVLAPVGERITFGEQGRIRLLPIGEPSIYSPSIDSVMVEVARRYGPDSGAILFSGMGRDGVLGSKAIRELGGTVWTQEPSNCVISSMVEAARAEGVVSRSALPSELAVLLAQQLNEE